MNIEDRKTIKEKIEPRLKKAKEATMVGVYKTMELPTFVWDKFNYKKTITGAAILSAGVLLEIYAPWAHFISGYIVDAGLGMTLLGISHKAIKNKETIKLIVSKIIKRGKK